MTFPFASSRKNKQRPPRTAARKQRRPETAPARGYRPGLELLEDRTAPALFALTRPQVVVSGTVFRDLNADGIHNATEPGLSDRFVYADGNNNRQLDPSEIATATDAKGFYTLTLDPGQYFLHLDPLPGLNETGTAPAEGGYHVTLPAGSEAVGRDFGTLVINPAAPLRIASAPVPEVETEDEAYIQDLYRDLLGRNAEPAETAYWASQLATGQPVADDASRLARESVAAGIWNSPEHRGLQVESYYDTLLDRGADAAGKDYWVAVMLSGASEVDVVHGFLASAEYEAGTPSDTAFASALYVDLLARAADAAGLDYWLQAMQASMTRPDVVDGFLFSTESLTRLVDSYYAAFLNRPAEPEGMAYWLALLQQRDHGLHKVGASFLASDENFQAGLGAGGGLGDTLPTTITVNTTENKLFQAPYTTMPQPGATISLRDAINLANKSPNPDTIVLEAFQIYNLDQVDNYWYGPNGLPAISSPITIQGNGATIQRVGGPNFRILYVSNQQYGGLATGNLTLQGLTVQNGVAKGGDSYQGGGGLGAGGAIFNAGTLVLDSVLLTNNTALGGSTSGAYAKVAGAGIGQDAGSGYCAAGGFGGPLPGATSPGFAADGGQGREGQGAGYVGGPCETINSTPTFPGFGGGGESTGFMNGGFGGGGGGVPDYSNDGIYGKGGFGGGDGATYTSAYSARGGGGAGLGGAVFNRGGTVTVVNSTVGQNHARGGDGATHVAGFRPPSGAGSGFGGGIFNLNGTLHLTNATIARNDVAAGGGGFAGRADGYQAYNLADGAASTLTLANTILAYAPSGQHDLVNQTTVNAPTSLASVTNVGGKSYGNPAMNIITTDVANLDANFAPGGAGVVTVEYRQVDPVLGDLSNNGGWSHTMAPSLTGPAWFGGRCELAVNASGVPLTFDQRGAIYQRTFTASIGMCGVDIGALQSQRYREHPALARLAYYDPSTNLFLPYQTPHNITNSTMTADNVYVIAHGWMAGYDTWVDQAKFRGDLPLSWQTWQGPPPAPYYGKSTPWLNDPSSANTYDYKFPIASGLAQEILTVDPQAKVLAYSWIDESATPVGSFGVPEAAYQSEGYTALAGAQMAEAIMEALAPDYSTGLGKVHLIGHSHGSRVATVAAVLLQKAAAVDSKFDVVRQLTLLDSPEDNSKSYPNSERNPVYYQDSANFDWFYLAQIDKPSRRAVQGKLENGSHTVDVTGSNTQFLEKGWGVTGPGIPAGTTIDWISPNKDQVRLTAPVTVQGGGTASLELLFWDWRNHTIFVDSYTSYFGSPFNNINVSDPDQGIVRSLFDVVDVHLDPYPIFHDTVWNIGQKHEYAANWYAGSASTKGTDHQSGLFWSPLIEGSSAPPASSSQLWTPVDADHQFRLTAQQPPSSVQPVFHQVTLNTEQAYHVTTAGPAGAVTAVTLTTHGPPFSDNPDENIPIFEGSFTKQDASVGFSFDYNFTEVGGDQAELQILRSDGLYFGMISSVAVSSLPSSGHFSATFGLGGTGSRKETITIQLVPYIYDTGTTVTVSNFHEFTIG